MQSIVSLGKDIVKRKLSTGFQHPGHFTVESSFVSNIHLDMLRPDDIEVAIGKRQGKRTALPKNSLIRQANSGRQHFGNPTVFLGQIKSYHIAAGGGRQEPAGSTQTAADIEQHMTGLDFCPLDQFLGGWSSTNVELVNRR